MIYPIAHGSLTMMSTVLLGGEREAILVAEFFLVWDYTVYWSIVYMFPGTTNAKYHCDKENNNRKPAPRVNSEDM